MIFRLTCVCAFVDVKMSFLGEAFVADMAGEGAIPNVCLLVLYQFPIGGQGLVAVVAGVG